ncbi:redoxin family protein [Paludibaculum fermentans]|uniref:Redoxin family protein n=1 Tax=Paludibaculum fermentans TaxID=1473598 RepID=A0A7S7SPJ7_PALFE|nr:redoxin family protein [Paludibaculum fermentans]QOY91671.1 redoxin family protein [Paludibaculum fermentans]
MKTLFLIVLSSSVLLLGQSKPPAKAPSARKAEKAEPAQQPEPAEKQADDPAARENQELERSLGESGGSPVEYTRALERHLKKYPDSARRQEIIRVLAQAAVENRDKARLVLYGVPAIESGARGGAILDNVTRTLLDRDDKESAEKALKYSRMLVEMVSDQRKSQLESKEPGSGRGRRLDETEYALTRAYTFEARALSNLARFDEALEAARKGWAVCPTAENAFERARLLEKAGKPKDALESLAEALALNDERTAPTDAAKEGARLGELSKKAFGDENGFGAVALAAYQRVGQATTARQARLKQFDPNFGAKAPADFTLGGVSGEPVSITSLKGKVVILDFWATWCGPCRAQHPLYEQAKLRFKDNPDVIFLNVSTDEDRGAVKPFLEAQKWKGQFLYEDGLAVLLRINSIPTTVILDRQGAVVSRMNGYIADRFVDMLSDRIRDALEN